MHGELGRPHIQCTAANAAGQNRTDSRPTEHVIADGKLLCRNAPLLGEFPAGNREDDAGFLKAVLLGCG